MLGVWWVKDEDLNHEQKGVITLDLDGSFLILGPPGSGKTNLLLLRAKYLALAKKSNVLVLSFTGGLRGFLASGADGYKVPPDRVRTSISWMQALLYDHGGDPDVEAEDFDTLRLTLLSRVTEVVKKKKLRHLYDAILLDEAQDYLIGEVQLLEKLTPRLFAVADSQQKIYSGDDPTEYLKSKVKETKVLKYHYRNGHSICRLADGIAAASDEYVPMLPTSNYDEKKVPSSVDVFTEKDLDTQVQKVVKGLQTQLKAYPNEMLGVLVPRLKELEKVWQFIESSPVAKSTFKLSGDDHGPFESETPVCVSTIHSAKGLEFRALHLVSAEHIKRFPQQRNVAYTAITRAKTSLSIYHTGALPGYIESAAMALSPAPTLPKLKDVFGA